MLLLQGGLKVGWVNVHGLFPDKGGLRGFAGQEEILELFANMDLMDSYLQVFRLWRMLQEQLA